MVLRISLPLTLFRALKNGKGKGYEHGHYDASSLWVPCGATFLKRHPSHH
jgi:hypothetical protein